VDFEVMLNQDDNQHDWYARRYLSRVFRTTCEMTGTNHKGGVALIEVGSLVEAVDANRLCEPTYRKKRTRNGHVNEVSDDGVRLTVVLLNERGDRHKHDISCDSVTHDMLVDEPGIVNWPREFSQQANMQGWDIFFCDGSDGPLWQLQAVTEEGRFETENGTDDTLAWEFVWNKAVDEEDPICLAALAYLRHRSPKEYNEIRKHCLEANKRDN
jgi:hypothetical protein